MTDLATLRQSVIEDFHLDSSGDADEHVNRAACAALEDLRPMEFPFNQGVFSIVTVADQASYPINAAGASETDELPNDFFGVLGEDLELDHEQAGDRPRILKFADVQTLQRERWWINSSGLPSRWTFDQNKLWLGPHPPDSVDGVSGRYLKDLNTPIPKYAASAWTYTGSTTGSSINTSTFTNAWFTNAFEILMARTAWRYFTTHDRSEKDAAAAQGLYQAALDKLERQRGPKQVVGRIEPFLGGSPAYGGHGRDYWG